MRRPRATLPGTIERPAEGRRTARTRRVPDAARVAGCGPSRNDHPCQTDELQAGVSRNASSPPSSSRHTWSRMVGSSSPPATYRKVGSSLGEFRSASAAITWSESVFTTGLALWVTMMICRRRAASRKLAGLIPEQIAGSDGRSLVNSSSPAHWSASALSFWIETNRSGGRSATVAAGPRRLRANPPRRRLSAWRALTRAANGGM